MKNVDKLTSFSVFYVVSLVVCLCFFASSAQAGCDEIYIKAGAGYKFDEQDFISVNSGDGVVTYELNHSRYSARFESGVECGSFTWGVSHHSQWATGAPFNNQWEYYKTEFFIDYKISWGL